MTLYVVKMMCKYDGEIVVAGVFDSPTKCEDAKKALIEHQNKTGRTSVEIWSDIYELNVMELDKIPAIG